MIDLKILPGFFSMCYFSPLTSLLLEESSKFENVIAEGYTQPLSCKYINVLRGVLPSLHIILTPSLSLSPTTPFCLPNNFAFIYVISNVCFLCLHKTSELTNEMGKYLSFRDELDQLNMMLPGAILCKRYDLILYNANFHCVYKPHFLIHSCGAMISFFTV